jgi:polysaccharide deacetylase family protein (PEP-CTERM system associated)
MQVPGKDGMRNVLSVDVEEHFQVEAFAGCVDRRNWADHPSRVEGNVRKILDLFDEFQVTATFFVLGWVCRRFPDLVREISLRGHEIGCHGFGHQRLQRLTPEQFRADLRAALASLTREARQPVRCYRAPSFSIVKSTMWAMDILVEEGFVCDSSIFPVRHDNYGVPDAPRFPHWQGTPGRGSIFEFPPSTVRIGRQNIGIGGGGYLRFAPYRVTRWAIQRINQRDRQPAMVYFHPWEIDPDQPRIAAPLRSRVRHYTNLGTMEQKIRSLLRDFTFVSLGDFLSRVPQKSKFPDRVVPGLAPVHPS